MVARLTTNQEVVISSITSVNFLEEFLSIKSFDEPLRKGETQSPTALGRGLTRAQSYLNLLDALRVLQCDQPGYTSKVSSDRT